MRWLTTMVASALLVCGCGATDSGDQPASLESFEPARPLNACYGIILPDSIQSVDYAAEKEWYQKGEGLRLFGDYYVRFGAPRPRIPEITVDGGGPADTLAFAALYDGVPLYAKASELPTPGILYVLLNKGCGWQAYAQGAMLR